MFLGSLEALPQSLAVFWGSCFSFSEVGVCFFTGSFGVLSFFMYNQDGHVALLLYDPYTLRPRREYMNLAVRWFVR